VTRTFHSLRLKENDEKRKRKNESTSIIDLSHERRIQIKEVTMPDEKVPWTPWETV
jgi:hypothetical protein